MASQIANRTQHLELHLKMQMLDSSDPITISGSHLYSKWPATLVGVMKTQRYDYFIIIILYKKTHWSLLITAPTCMSRLSHARPEEMLMSYCEVINYFFVIQATDNIIALAHMAIINFKQSIGQSAVDVFRYSE